MCNVIYVIFCDNQNIWINMWRNQCPCSGQKKHEAKATTILELESGLIHIRAMIRAMARTLTLKPKQVMLLYEYIHKVRPALLKTETDRLVVSLRATPESGEGINYLVETFKPMFPDWNLNPRRPSRSIIRWGELDITICDLKLWYRKMR